MTVSSPSADSLLQRPEVQTRLAPGGAPANAKSSFAATLLQMEEVWGQTFDAARSRADVQQEGELASLAGKAPFAPASIGHPLLSALDNPPKMSPSRGTVLDGLDGSGPLHAPTAGSSSFTEEAGRSSPFSKVNLATDARNSTPAVGRTSVTFRHAPARPADVTLQDARAVDRSAGLSRPASGVGRLLDTRNGINVGSDSIAAIPSSPVSRAAPTIALPQPRPSLVATEPDATSSDAATRALPNEPDVLVPTSVRVANVAGGLAVSLWTPLRSHEDSMAHRKLLERELARFGCQVAQLHINGIRQAPTNSNRYPQE